MTKVAVVAVGRTPFLKAQTGFASYSALHLSSELLRGFLAKYPWVEKTVEEVFYSSVLLDPRYPNLARELVLRSSLPKTVGAHFLSNNCISGLLTLNAAYESILTGRIKVALSGGVESMSRPALISAPKAQDFFLRLNAARNFKEKIGVLTKFKPAYLLPVAPSPKEPSTGLTMGQHCEISAQEFQISRAAQDSYALASHQKASEAHVKGYFSEEIIPVYGQDRDNLIRKDTTIEKLARLPKVFDRGESGSITAGNASALTDGASLVCLMSEDFAKQHGYPILGYIEKVQFAAIAPSDGLLMAPALALPKLMQKLQLNISAVDLFEVHEAFAAQVLCNQKLWAEGWSKYPDISAIGEIPAEKMNVNGGSLALGHPFAATGGRLVASALNQLARSSQQRAVLSVCAAGAMAAAVSLTSAQ